MRASFLLAWRTLVRTRVVPLLALFTLFAYWALPALVRGDGTAAGYREVFVRAVSGSVTAVVAVTLLVCACGSFAQDRAAQRLSLALVRRVSAPALVAGRYAAFCAAALLVLALNGVLACLFPRACPAPVCRHHVAPALEAPIVAARAALADYLADPRTPESVKKAPRSAVLALLAGKELDRYDAIKPGATRTWPFDASALARAAAPVVRVRFATPFEIRAPVAGVFTLGGFSATVSNATQNVLDVPLAGTAAVRADALSFTNTGRETVLLRPRRDLEVLLPADAHAANVARAMLQVFSAVALLAAFGLFLSSALSRPVAIFTALVAVAVALMAPSVLEQYPDALDARWADRVGLALSRGVGCLTASAAAATPLSDLATDRAIELPALLRSLAVNALLLPALLLSLSSLLLRRKPQEVPSA